MDSVSLYSPYTPHRFNHHRFNHHITTHAMTIKSYSKQELALLYFPDSDPSAALKRLKRWINRIPELRDSIRKDSMGEHAKFWSRTQVKQIVAYLDEP